MEDWEIRGLQTTAQEALDAARQARRDTQTNSDSLTTTQATQISIQAELDQLKEEVYSLQHLVQAMREGVVYTRAESPHLWSTDPSQVITHGMIGIITELKQSPEPKSVFYVNLPSGPRMLDSREEAAALAMLHGTNDV